MKDVDEIGPLLQLGVVDVVGVPLLERHSFDINHKILEQNAEVKIERRLVEGTIGFRDGVLATG